MITFAQMTMADMNFEASLAYAQEQDQVDTLYSYRTRFHFPQHEGRDVVYMCGNSLGLQHKSVEYLMQQELKDWAKHGVEGHFQAVNPWFSYHHIFSERLAKLVGAKKRGSSCYQYINGQSPPTDDIVLPPYGQQV